MGRVTVRVPAHPGPVTASTLVLCGDTPKSRSTTLSALLFAIVAASCSDAPVAPSAPFDVSLAKGGPGTQRVDFTISDAAADVVSDGKGTYRDGICGVVGVLTSTGFHLAPAEGRVPKSQQASCAGIAPRAATLTLAVEHLQDNPHQDANGTTGSGSFSVQNVKFGFGSAGASTINAAPSCGTLGLRFSPLTYPGSDGLVREDLGGGQWHMYSLPWPDNVAYCANGSSVKYWHVVVDLQAQVR